VAEDRKYYWFAQVTAWGIWSGLLGLFNYVNDIFGPVEVAVISLIILMLGIGLSHAYRWFMISDRWLRLPLMRLFPRAVIGSLVCGTIYTLALASILDLFFSRPDSAVILGAQYDLLFQLLVTWILIFMIWSAAYLAYNYVRNYEHEEIKNLKLESTSLKLESSRNEMELNSLRAQLNPHFMFNAMNSIRALINEDPELAKNAVTKLSNILRNTLISGKKNTVTLEEEMAIVKDHLALEKIRYEERLSIKFDIQPGLMSFKIPPLVIQTLVENGIKHGVSKITEGGLLQIEVKSKNDCLHVVVENSGQLQENARSETGIGLDNAKKRLKIMYGSSASLLIKNKNESTVRTELIIPEYTKE
jgi:sensor histidine kinase YesM